MPMSIFPIAAIQSVRLTCRQCGAAVVIPLTAKAGPAQCFNCNHRLPGPELVQGLVRELHWLQDAARAPGAEASIAFDAAIEHEQAG